MEIKVLKDTLLHHQLTFVFLAGMGWTIQQVLENQGTASSSNVCLGLIYAVGYTFLMTIYSQSVLGGIYLYQH